MFLDSIPPIHKYVPLVLGQTFGRQVLERTPEPDAVTDQADHVLQYDQVMSTKLAIAYAVALEMIYRCREEPFGGEAIDLACGPGHMSLCMAKYLRLERLQGVDLSLPMVEVANVNAAKQGVQSASFVVGDVTSLSDIEASSRDLSTFCDAAHHMPSIEEVRKVLNEMDRITRPEGLVFVMDLARLKSESLTQQYVTLVGADYHSQGLSSFYKDFSNSMLAAWTIQELALAVPFETNRHWYHLAPRGLPTVQFLFGVPRTQNHLFLRRGFPWGRAEESPLDRGLRSEWFALRQSLNMSSPQRLDPINKKVAAEPKGVDGDF